VVQEGAILYSVRDSRGEKRNGEEEAFVNKTAHRLLDDND
jgi:hypothetical protein